jgi:hypothetical protein
MKIRASLFFLAAALVVHSSCSYRESFIIANEGSEPVVVHYLLDTNKQGFPIFTNKPSLYAMDGAGYADWEKLQSFADKDTSALGVQLILPPGSILIFGHLSNDSYKRYDQAFINGRTFNLQRIQISQKGPDLVIAGPEFDKHFTKKKGHIQYRIK